MADQDSPTEKGIQSLLVTAVKSLQLDVVKSLLTQYPSLPLDEEIVRAAVNTGSIPMFEILLAHNPSVVTMQFEKRGYPLTVAAMGRQKIEYLRFLLESGADPNQNPDVASLPLALVAALYKDTAAIDLLLRYGACLEHSGALAAAARLGNERMIHRLLEHGARFDTDASTTMGTHASSPLHAAVRGRHVNMTRILLQHGVDLNATDASGVTAIEVAMQMKQKGEEMSEILELLEGEQQRR